MNPLTKKEITEETSSKGAYDKLKKEHSITIPGSYDHSLQYLFGNRDDYSNLVVPLYEASVTGDWETAKTIFEKRPDLVRYGLSMNLGTALHVAVTSKVTKQTLHFVKNLVNMMKKEDLELKNAHGNTAFIIACACGKIKMAKMILEKNGSVMDIRGNIVYLPLSYSVMNGTHEIVKWLYDLSHKMTGDPWHDEDRYFILFRCVGRGFFDIVLQILEDRPELAENNVDRLLVSLARKRKRYAIDRVEKKLITRITERICRFFVLKAEEDPNAHKLLKIIWGQTTRTMDLDRIHGMLKGTPSSGILFVAAETGNTMFIVEVLRSYPDFMLDRNEDGLTIFHVAVMRRHQGIYNLLYEIGNSIHDICLFTDKSDNNMLHLVGKTSKEMASKTSKASLPMQRELLWFKEVEKMMPPYLREAKNKAGQTPYELFYKENEVLVSKELKWMKDCMVVATLIVTLAFAAAFTVPGDYKEDKGIPFFIHQRVFLVFAIANSVSLFSSSTSLLVFLSILTSRQEQHDFYISLPSKLTTGLLTLLISVGAMMVTFSASFFLLFRKGLSWVPILVATFTAVPVIVFAILQSPLLVDMLRSMYDPHYLFNPRKRMLYITKPPRSCSKNSCCWWFPY